MKAKQLILIVVILWTAACAAAAQSDLVNNSPKKSANSANQNAIVNGSDRRNLDKYFDKNLADLIWGDFTSERGEDDPNETGVIDKATVRASFNSGGTHETVEYSLVEENSAWKIADIKYRDVNSLLKRFKDAMP